jgi:hypothetical protein
VVLHSSISSSRATSYRDDTPPLSPLPAAARGKPNIGSRVGSQCLGDRGLLDAAEFTRMGLRASRGRDDDSDKYGPGLDHRERRPGESPAGNRRCRLSVGSRMSPLGIADPPGHPALSRGCVGFRFGTSKYGRRGMDDPACRLHDDLPLPDLSGLPQPVEATSAIMVAICEHNQWRKRDSTPRRR